MCYKYEDVSQFSIYQAFLDDPLSLSHSLSLNNQFHQDFIN